MNTEQIIKIFENSGFHVYGIHNGDIVMEDPACILRSFEVFINYAWDAIVVITVLLLIGWAVTAIRGVKNSVPNMVNGIKNLLVIFGILAAIVPILKIIYGGDFIARGCNQIRVPGAEIQKILDARNARITDKENELYEEFSIYDTGAASE